MSSLEALRLINLTLELAPFKRKLGKAVVSLYSQSLDIIEADLRKVKSTEYALETLKDALGEDVEENRLDALIQILKKDLDRGNLLYVLPAINYLYCSSYHNEGRLLEAFLSEAEEMIDNLCDYVERAFEKAEKKRLISEITKKGLTGSFVAHPVFDTSLTQIPSSYHVKDKSGYAFFTYDCQTSYTLEDTTFLWAQLNLGRAQEH